LASYNNHQTISKTRRSINCQNEVWNDWIVRVEGADSPLLRR
jgi:hypothetical protein